MNADEIVRGLRWLAKVRTYCNAHMVNCKECEFTGFCTDLYSGESISGQAGQFKYSADLIESLQAQLADYHHMSELVDGKMEENQRLRRINEDLQEQLAASRHRVQDARNELCLKCVRYRDAHKGACDGCRWKE